jgi:acyl-CoA thioesterase FadM
VFEPVHSGDVLIGTTMVLGWRRVWARRQTEFADSAGRLVARGRIDWVLLGSGGSPTRIPALFESVFGARRETFALARVDPGDEPADAARTSFTVRPQELDPLAHVNNAVYLDWVEEAVAAVGGDAGPAIVGRIRRTARLEYARAAEPGSTVDLVAWSGGDEDRRTWSVRISDRSGAELVRARLEG